MTDSRTVRSLLADAANRLAAVGIPSPAMDAELLLAHVLGTTRSRLILLDTVDDDVADSFAGLLARRRARVPLQHLTGEGPFRRLTLAVGPGVFVPRPETELVGEVAIRHLREVDGPRRAVDLCAGSGALALSLATEVDDVSVDALELSDAAWPWLLRNHAAATETAAQRGSAVTLHRGSVAGCAGEGATLGHLRGQVHAVVSNPPYIPDDAVPLEPEVRDHDPALALFGGPDGLDVVREIVAAAAELLAPSGLLVIEHSDQQGDSAGAAGVPGLLRAAEWKDWFEAVRDHADLTGRPRYTTAVRRAARMAP